jgi:hypothetical protein
MAHLDDYEPVADRLDRFWNDHPNGRVVPRLEHLGRHPDGSLMDCTFSAAIYRDQGDSEPFATGTAYELRTDRGVNQLSAVENAETSAIGRALANGGYAAKGGPRPSREEMQKATRVAPQTTGGDPDPAAGPRAGGGAVSPGAAPSPAPPTMGEAIGNVVDAMPGSRVVSQGDTPPPARDHGHPTPATDRQKGMIRRLCKVLNLDGDLAREYVGHVLGKPVTFDDLTKTQASDLITAMKEDEAKQADPANNPAITEDPWAQEGAF